MGHFLAPGKNKRQKIKILNSFKTEQSRLKAKFSHDLLINQILIKKR